MRSLPRKAISRLRLNWQRRQINRQVQKLIRQVESVKPAPAAGTRPVVLFNASTRLTGISLNAGFSLLTRLGLELAGIPTVQFACRAGMSRCVLGTDRNDPAKAPPCQSCIAQTRALASGAPVVWFDNPPDPSLAAKLEGLSIAELSEFTQPLPPNPSPLSPRGKGIGVRGVPPSPEGEGWGEVIPLGHLALPALRWVLRRHHLADDESTRFLLRHYILSAWNIAQAFTTLLNEENPQAVIVFNGQFFPEATARWVAQQRGLPVISHEVGLRPFTAFVTPGDATAYPLRVPDDFKLDERQNARLDEYLSQRFQGQFSMAGVRFWPEMKGLDPAMLARMAEFQQVVPVFTNVIFDTSQPHSNVVFPHMFAWLDLVLELARAHPETLFVLRAHPDEGRPGKASQESVHQWVERTQADRLPNLVFIDSRQPLSSYELIRRSKFVLIYNSTIGLEASLLGAAVLCAGRARFTQLPTVFFPPSQEAFRLQAEQFLAAQKITVPPEFAHNARRFLYYQLYFSSLPFSEYLEEDGIWPGFVRLRSFAPGKLTPAQSPAMRAILNGLLHGGSFLLDDDR
jgi:hypothetical protein